MVNTTYNFPFYDQTPDYHFSLNSPPFSTCTLYSRLTCISGKSPCISVQRSFLQCPQFLFLGADTFLETQFLCAFLPKNLSDFLARNQCIFSVLLAAAAAKSLQSCPTLCNPIDGSPPGSPVPGILQARTLEWAAISFSNAWK